MAGIVRIVGIIVEKDAHRLAGSLILATALDVDSSFKRV